MTLKGHITDFFETGTEGICWILEEDGKTGYDAIVSIDNGDHLKILGENGEIIFEGIIEEDYKVGWKSYNNPKLPQCGQPCALGYWIHWTQKGWDPDKWAELFFRSPRLRAELIKKKR